jgi:transcriptional regulator with XRE-family HTH domain
MPRSPADPRFAATLRRLRTDRRLSLRGLARKVVYGKSYLHELETGLKPPTPEVGARLDAALDAGGQLAALACGTADPAPVDDYETDALDLAQRVEASDVSAHTLERLEAAADDLAVAYATVATLELRQRIRRYTSYVNRLVDARATPAQRRRLLVAGGWLALLAGTVDIDLNRLTAAHAWLTTARQMAEHARHDEIRAWTVETRAWSLLGIHDYERALSLSREAQDLAPRGSSALIQATAQEGRALARLGDAPATRQVLARLDRLVSPLPLPDRPEHHYRYDPGKALAYTATILAWIGDPAAVDYARTVARELEAPAEGPPRPRRAAIARLDLSLALLRTGQLDEAAATAESAITAGMLASNYWRAAEVVAGVEDAGISEAARLREAYETYRPVVKNGAPCPQPPRTTADS